MIFAIGKIGGKSGMYFRKQQQAIGAMKMVILRNDGRAKGG